MITEQRSLESLLLRDKNRQPHQWLYHIRNGFGNVIDYIADNGNIRELPHRKVKRKRLLTKGFSNVNFKDAVHIFTMKKKTNCEFRSMIKDSTKLENETSSKTIFNLGSKPTRCDQDVISVNNKTIHLSYAVCTFTMKKKTKWESKSKIKGSTKLEDETSTKTSFNLGSVFKSKIKGRTKLENEPSTKTSLNLGTERNTKLGFKSSAKTNVNHIAIRPIFLVADSSAIESLYHNVGEEIILVGSSVVDQDQGRQEWYKQLDHFVFLEELVTSVLCDYTTVTHNNILKNFRFKDPQMLTLYDVHRAHMYGVDDIALYSLDPQFYVPPFLDKQIATILDLSTAPDSSFGLKLKDDELLCWNYVSNIKDTINKDQGVVQKFSILLKSLLIQLWYIYLYVYKHYQAHRKVPWYTFLFDSTYHMNDSYEKTIVPEAKGFL